MAQVRKEFAPTACNTQMENNKENEAPLSPSKVTPHEQVARKPIDGSRRRPSSCVFVASLRSTRSDDELCRSVTQHFEAFGELASVKVLRDPMNRPYAFVQYTNDTDCKQAIKLGHNSELDGRKLRCEAAKVNRTLFVSFYREMAKSEVENQMWEFGEPELVAPSSHTGRVIDSSSPQASFNWFVKFSYRDDAIRAFACLSDDDELHVEWAQNIDDVSVRSSQFDKFAIFIGQLPQQVTEEEIRSHFSYHGEVKDVNIIHKSLSTFAFVTFETEASAASAVARDNHSLFMNKTIHVQYREVPSKTNSKVLLSPRMPVALAPPPIHLRRFSNNFSKWPSTVRPTPCEIYTPPLKPSVYDASSSQDYAHEYYIKEASAERVSRRGNPRTQEPRKGSSQFTTSEPKNLYYLIPSPRKN